MGSVTAVSFQQSFVNCDLRLFFFVIRIMVNRLKIAFSVRLATEHEIELCWMICFVASVACPNVIVKIVVVRCYPEIGPCLLNFR